MVVLNARFQILNIQRRGAISFQRGEACGANESGKTQSLKCDRHSARLILDMENNFNDSSAKLHREFLLTHFMQHDRKAARLMKKSALIRLASLIGITLTGLAAQAQVINYHNAYQYANYLGGGGGPGAPLYGSMVYVGQGAYSDPGHNVWNGFGGGFNPTSNGFSPGNAGHTTGTYPQYYSDGSGAPTTLTVNYGFDNGGLTGSMNTYQGLPNFILGQEAGVDGGSPGIGTAGAPEGEFILHNVPTGLYTMYLYGQNFDADRGAIFSLAGANGGTFAGGNGTINNGTKNAFIQGVNYVVVNGVTPDGSGNITGFWIGNPDDVHGGNEGSFNGLQLIPVPEPSSFALLGLGAAGLIIFRRRK